MADLMEFDLPKEQSSIIKVIGIGGGGSNAVNHMFLQGIKDVSFVVCNTDAQALAKSPVPIRIQLGASLTEGRGAGNKPDQGKQAAIENLDDVADVLVNNTKMVFITAGMGGGTGTGAAPVIAKAAKDMGILTVGIVTIPFRFEGKRRIQQALEGIKELKDHVDSLLVINNEKLREIYGDLTFTDAFAKADNVLTIAAKGIAEIITVHGILNVDFADVQTVMKDSGIAILGSAKASGEGRALEVIKDALTSPLLNNNDMKGAKNILLNITSGTSEITMDEIGEITDYVQDSAGQTADIIWGHGIDDSLGDKISVTIIATGFETDIIPELMMAEKKDKKYVPLTDKTTENLVSPLVVEPVKDVTTGKEVFNFELKDTSASNKEEDYTVIPVKREIYDYNAAEMEEKAKERIENLKKSYDRLKELSNLNNPKDINEMESVPAYKRQKIELDDSKPSEKSDISRFILSEDKEKNVSLREDNSYLHDNVD